MLSASCPELLASANVCDEGINFSASRFEARWTHLRLNTQSSCLFFKGLPEMIELPVAHAEGKLVLKQSI